MASTATDLEVATTVPEVGSVVLGVSVEGVAETSRMRKKLDVGVSTDA